MAQHFGDYYYPEFADTVKYIEKDILIWIIKQQCSDWDESKWKCFKDCQLNVNDGLRQIKWLNIVDPAMEKWASTERQRFFVMCHVLS